MIIRVNTPQFPLGRNGDLIRAGAITTRLGWADPNTTTLSNAPYMTDDLRLGEPHAPFGVFSFGAEEDW